MVVGIFLSSIFIDVVTYFSVKFARLVGIAPKRKIPKKYINNELGISIIIPAYNEERYIERSVRSAFNQTIKPEKVIVIDDYSQDKTLDICYELKNEFPNLEIINQNKNMGKSYNVKQIINNFELTEITIVLDSDTFIEKNYLDEITKPFFNERVVIVTGRSLPFKPTNFIGKIIYHGAIFQYKFFCFRKEAHSFRNSIAVISGDSSAYRTNFLKEIGGFPQGTVTEDMDLTWLALEHGHRVVFEKKALARSNDPSTLISHIKQIIRWYSGSFQCIFRHRSNLLKAKPLLFTTIIPIYFDTMIYAPVFVIALILIPFFPKFSAIFFLADLIYTTIAILILNWKSIIRLPEIYIVKLIWAIAFSIALFKTTLEFILGRTYWGGTWGRDDFYLKKK